jgi:hypothetical protein
MPGDFVVEVDHLALAAFLDNPHGTLALDVMTPIAEVVKNGAKRRAEVRTGRMRDSCRYSIAHDEAGVYADVGYTAVNDKGFPYPLVHEDRRVRDRRPHRSLRPALNDVTGFLGG